MPHRAGPLVRPRSHDVTSPVTIEEAIIVAKSNSNARSTSGDYINKVLEKQMSGFYLALGTAAKAKEGSSPKGAETKQPSGTSKSK